jgi:hypothetical protein
MKNQCTAIHRDIAPPHQCELESGHDGDHQFTLGKTTVTWKEVTATPVVEAAAADATSENIPQ